MGNNKSQHKTNKKWDVQIQSKKDPANSDPKLIDEHQNIKIVLAGDKGAGKSSLLMNFLDPGTNISKIQPTTTNDYYSIRRPFNQYLLRVAVWDIGSVHMKSFSSDIFRDANGVIVCFDVTKQDSLKHVKYWIEDAYRIAGEEVQIIIVGCKSDCKASKGFQGASSEEAESFSKNQGLTYFETSAKLNLNISQSFDVLLQMVLDQRKEE